MEESVLTSVVLPAALFLIMLGMGLSLVVNDFKRVVAYPKAAVVGLFCQVVLLPACAFLLAIGFALRPELAVGLMIIAACPGGVTSNLVTHVARGDTALSVTLTAINSAIAIFTIPLIVGFGLEYFLDASQGIELPVLKTIGQVFGITAVPVSIGMFIRARNPDFADRMDRPARIGSAVVFVLIVAGIIAANLDLLREHFAALSGVTFALNLVTMSLGLVAGKVVRLPHRQTLTIAIEAGIQNGTLAIVIATSILKQGDMALPGGFYSLVMFVSGAAVMIYGSQTQGSSEDEAAHSGV
ncbi:MAG: bile acid:sodium symporter family protein [Persicimonas sp.]